VGDPLRKAVKQLLRGVGLAGPARRAKQLLHSEGLLDWRPLVPAEPFSASCDLAIETLRAYGHEFGDYLEFGVSRGTSMACMYHALRKARLSHVRLVGFDSFEGMPKEAAGQGWRPGDFASTLGATQRYLRRAGVDAGKVHLVKGWFTDTLTPGTIERLAMRKASLIMVDCDIYTATKEALWFCEPLILDHAVILFDDWGWRADVGKIGQQEAFAEYLEEFPQIAFEPLPAYIPQARVFLVTRTAAASELQSRHLR
jgi:O-methyltransferase